MSGPQVGDRVIDLTFLRPDGDVVLLSRIPGALLLIFLRHLH